MIDDKAVMQQALDVLLGCLDHPDAADAIEALEVAIAQTVPFSDPAAQQSWELHLEQADAIRELLDLHAPDTEGNLQTRLAQVFSQPVQQTEQNFCARCGKRLAGDGIHTCTPPKPTL